MGTLGSIAGFDYSLMWAVGANLTRPTSFVDVLPHRRGRKTATFGREEWPTAVLVLDIVTNVLEVIIEKLLRFRIDIDVRLSIDAVFEPSALLGAVTKAEVGIGRLGMIIVHIERMKAANSTTGDSQ